MSHDPPASSVLPLQPFGSVIAKYLCDVTTISSILPPATDSIVTVLLATTPTSTVPNTTGFGVKPVMDSFPGRKVATCLGLGAVTSKKPRAIKLHSSVTTKDLPHTYSLLPSASTVTSVNSANPSRHSSPLLRVVLIPILVARRPPLIAPAAAVLVGVVNLSEAGRFSITLIEPFVHVPLVRPVMLPTTGLPSPIATSDVANEPLSVIGHSTTTLDAKSLALKIPVCVIAPPGLNLTPEIASALTDQPASNIAAASSARPCRHDDVTDIDDLPQVWIRRTLPIAWPAETPEHDRLGSVGRTLQNRPMSSQILVLRLTRGHHPR